MGTGQRPAVRAARAEARVWFWGAQGSADRTLRWASFVSSGAVCGPVAVTCVDSLRLAQRQDCSPALPAC